MNEASCTTMMSALQSQLKILQHLRSVDDSPWTPASRGMTA